jgi:hypothetical protein
VHPPPLLLPVGQVQRVGQLERRAGPLRSGGVVLRQLNELGGDLLQVPHLVERPEQQQATRGAVAHARAGGLDVTAIGQPEEVQELSEEQPVAQVEQVGPRACRRVVDPPRTRLPRQRGRHLVARRLDRR